MDILDFETEVEPVYNYRVMRQINDSLRNPEGDWVVYFSSTSEKTANLVANRENDNKFGDVYKVVFVA